MMKASRTDYLAQRDLIIKKTIKKKVGNSHAQIGLIKVKHEWVSEGPFGFNRFEVDATVNGKLKKFILENL